MQFNVEVADYMIVLGRFNIGSPEFNIEFRDYMTVRRRFKIEVRQFKTTQRRFRVQLLPGCSLVRRTGSKKLCCAGQEGYSSPRCLTEPNHDENNPQSLTVADVYRHRDEY